MKYILFALLFLPGIIMASGKKAPTAAVSFHLETSADEFPKFARKVNTLAGDGYYRLVPEASTKDVTAFTSFPAEDGNTYGLVFKLDKEASRRLQATTSLHNGKLLLAMINGQPHGVVRIDRAISDGVLVIWKGVKLEHIRFYDETLPRIGESKQEWKERRKKEKKKAKQ